MERQGASIIAGSGAIARHDRLTVVAGGSVIQGSDDLGRSALRMLDTLDAAGDWSFEAVAAALHQLVLDEDPRGVAAVLADNEGEVLLFAFDRASAQGGEVVANGNGRSGWTTQVADGSAIQLRLDNVPFKAAENDIELRAGLVPGAGALLTVTPFFQQPVQAIARDEGLPQSPDAPQAALREQAGAPPPPTGVRTSPAVPPNYLPAPPPAEANKVDSSLLPPPPGEWRPGHPPPTPSHNQPSHNQPSHNPPPPAGPASKLPPPPTPSGSQSNETPAGPPPMGS